MKYMLNHNLETKNLLAKFKIWESLMDTSIYFTLAGMKQRGYSDKESWNKLCSTWENASCKHRQGNLRIAQILYGKRNQRKQDYS